MKLMMLYLTIILFFSIVCFVVGVLLSVLNRFSGYKSGESISILIPISLVVGIFSGITLRLYYIVLYTEKTLVLDQVIKELVILTTIIAAYKILIFSCKIAFRAFLN